MTKDEELKNSRRVIHIRHILETAESKVYLDQISGQDITRTLDYLAGNLPSSLATKIFKHNHLRKLTNFWLLVSDRGQIKGMARSSQLISVFHQIAHYCNHDEIRHDKGRINITRPQVD